MTGPFVRLTTRPDGARRYVNFALVTSFGTDGATGTWLACTDAKTIWVDESPATIAGVLTDAVSVYEPPAARS